MTVRIVCEGLDVHILVEDEIDMLIVQEAMKIAAKRKNNPLAHYQQSLF